MWPPVRPRPGRPAPSRPTRHFANHSALMSTTRRSVLVEMEAYTQAWLRDSLPDETDGAAPPAFTNRLYTYSPLLEVGSAVNSTPSTQMNDMTTRLTVLTNQVHATFYRTRNSSPN